MRRTKRRDRTGSTPSRPLGFLTLAALVAVAATASACGGAGGGAGPGGSGQGLVMLSFLQDGFDNVQLNTRLEFLFSEEVDPTTVTAASLQLREGDAFGRSVNGTYRVVGSTVFFEPALPGLCDFSDAGFKAATDYRVQCIGRPEEFAIRNLHGQPLNQTTTYEFRTRAETDPDRFLDAIPATAPAVVQASPADGDVAVAVAPGNRIVLTMSENLDPCTVNDSSVLVHMFERGGKTIEVDLGDGRKSGFSSDGMNTGDPADQTPGDPLTWGATGSTPFSPPQKVLASIDLIQDFQSTEIVITPDFGQFPENALIVVRLTFDIADFGSTPLTPFVMAFTTENLPPQTGTYVLENAGETPYDEAQTTADVNSARAPSRVQGFLLFAGDGDNGVDPFSRSLPQSDFPACSTDYQPNNSDPDDFDPGGDVLLDSGLTVNQCVNSTDGSFAVVFEFKTFRIRNGVTVRVVGVNPVIVLVQGDIIVDPGGRLLLRGDNQGGSPRGDGEGNKNATTTAGTLGGVGVAGGGDGGACLGGSSAGSPRYSGHGRQGYFHISPTGPLSTDVGAIGVGGAGHGNSSAHWHTQTNPNNRNSPSGGGGGHAQAGQDGVAGGSGSSPTRIDLALDGAGGAEYGDSNGRLETPEAGSGGGAGGEVRPFSGNAGRGPGGGGGAGGGFIDLTCGGDMTILGTIDAAGGRGGSNPGGAFSPNYSWQPGTGGGGGGSGGGIRLLTPNDIVLGAQTVITAAGGPGGAGGASQAGGPPLNNGGAGGSGRIAMEDSNSIITGFATASVSPGEGDAGFYRSVFDATRFKGGGLTPVAVSELFAAGPLEPEYIAPVQDYGVQEDFIAGTPSNSSTGAGKTTMYIEARGFQMLPDGTPDTSGAPGTSTQFYSVGYFTDSTIESRPTWNPGHPPLADIGGALPADNVGAGITNLDGFEFLQLRFTVYLNANIGATDPGPWLDRWTIRFTHDQ